MLYMKLPTIKGLYYEVNMDESYGNMAYVDDCAAAYLCDGNQHGVIYNYCYDGKNEMSAIYKDDGYETDKETYAHYEIDFSFDDWKERLINRMIELYHEFWDRDD